MQDSAWCDIFCWLEEFFLMVNLEFSSSIRFVNSSILSLNEEICSKSWAVTACQVWWEWNNWKQTDIMRLNTKINKTICTILFYFKRRVTANTWFDGVNLSEKPWFLEAYVASLAIFLSLWFVYDCDMPLLKIHITPISICKTVFMTYKK